MAETKEVVDETKEEVTTETKEEIKPDDKEGEAKEEENKGEEKEESFDENKIDPEVRDYKPTAPEPTDDDDVDQEDKARIEKIMEKKYGGDINQIKQKVEMDTYFNTHPEDAKYRHAVELYKAHPTYAGIPIHNLAAMVSAKDAERRGAAKEREAARVAAETKNPGGTVRKPSGEAMDWKSAPKDDFEAQKAKVLGRMGN